MQNFSGRIAVVTGGGSGMGRELARQLAAAGAHVAVGDLFEDALAQTAAACEVGADPSVRVSTHVVDVADPDQVARFREGVAAEHDTQHVNLLFNNAGISGGGSFVIDDPHEWDRTFAVCWGGVYACTRVFLPMLLAADEGHVVNTSSVNGFWAALGPGIPHTAYSAAKFAVKGFTEALVTDFRLHAPHLRASVVMPGHVGTEIVVNSERVHRAARALATGDDGALTEPMRRRLRDFGIDVDGMTAAQIADVLAGFGERFRENAPLSAAQAATIILDGVRAERWRILVGTDAERLDRAVRADPEGAYNHTMSELLAIAERP